ncbi:hypothetical protein [Chroococcidiopsis sp.]|uniref:hypothetical protein n=1 Tax=Chroococcidiopsis sp. TaxID=3088168 RepID=UPI003F40C882
MPFLELTPSTNWQRVGASRYLAEIISNTPQEIEYKPIPPIYFTVESNFLLIGVQSDSAKPYWYLGANVSQYLYIAPDLGDANFPGGVQSSDQKKLGLNRLTLVNFQDYNISPYILLFEVPYWLRDLYIEVWQHIGGSSDSVQDALIDVKQRLERIEYKIDSINP